VSTWQIAWRLRNVALAASMAMFVLSMLLFGLTQLLFEVIGPGELSLVLLGALYLLPDALFVAMLLEAMLAEGGLPPWRRVLLPSARALGFTLAMAPFAVLASVLHMGARWPLERALLDAADGVPGPSTHVGLALLYQPGWDWLLLGLVAAPLAVRTLHLPRLAQRPSSTPDAALFGTIVAAAALSLAVAAGFALVAQVAPGAFYPVQWFGGYIASLLLLTPVAAAIGLLLMRRAGYPALA
jgi:hypothetical protein